MTKQQLIEKMIPRCVKHEIWQEVLELNAEGYRAILNGHKLKALQQFDREFDKQDAKLEANHVD